MCKATGAEEHFIGGDFVLVEPRDDFVGVVQGNSCAEKERSRLLADTVPGHPMLRVSEFGVDDVVPEEFRSTGVVEDHGTMVVTHKGMAQNAKREV
eukprot:6168176-Amphidinium_carterae.2